MRRILWIFAHQDDEVAAAARMLEQRRRGDDIWCAFLTDGALNVPAATRNAESVAALATLGITKLLFLEHRDGTLHAHVDEALAELETRFAGVTFDEVGCLAWEGGHHDHDASHLVALAFARARGIEAFEVPLYNGSGTPGSLFRVLRPIGEGWESRRITFSDALRIVRMIGFYPSQRRTWLALLPGTLLHVVLLRKTSSRRADPARVQHRPHDGRLFYERRFGCSTQTFTGGTAAFTARHLGVSMFGGIRVCPVCEGTRFTRRRLLPNLAVERCTGCGLRISEIVKTKRVSYAHIDDDAYLQSIGMVRQEQAKMVVRAVKAKGEWLDIGCGFGFVLDEARRAGFTVRGVEPDAKAAAAARARLGDVVRATDDHAPADVISTLDVLEHVPPPELGAFAEDIRSRASWWVVKVPSSEGLFYRVSHALLPFSRGVVRRLWQSDHEYPHTVYFDRPTLTRFLEKHGFAIEEVRYLEEVSSKTASQRMLLDPTIPRWQALLAAPLVRLVNTIERLRGTSDALLVIARRR
jgi:SAM-dependent methyltransferase